MTPVKFEFFEPDGTPLSNVTFEIRMAKSGFLEPVDGIIMPDTMEYTTDDEGTVTVLLKPSSSLYYLSVLNKDADETDCCSAGGIKYKFYVPDVEAVVRVQDLIMDPPPSTTAWDEAAMLLILDAKISSKASADAAKASEEIVVAAEAVVVERADQVAIDAVAVADNTIAAGQSEANAKQSEEAAAASELAAKGYADFAGSATTDMQEQVDEATRQAGLSSDYADSALLASNSAHADLLLTDANVITTNNNVTTTETNKLATAADVVAVTALKGDVNDLKDETKGYRDEALQALGTITGVIADGGQIDLSGGAYPPKPDFSTVWRVTTGGVVDGTDFAVGDQLFYTKENDYFYKQDGTENVHSVAGKKGDVVLVKGDVGLPLVDNTPDLNKPISNAQQAQFDIRVPTTSRLDTVAGHLVKVGDYGENGGSAIPRIVTDDANAISVSGIYAFTDGGVNVPEAVYLKHISHATAGYAKQIAYGILTEKMYVRTQKAGAWSVWTLPVPVIDNLTSTDTDKALSAKQGKVLQDLITQGSTIGYTKTEADALLNLRRLKTDYITTQYGGVSKSFIDGLMLTYISATSIAVSTGAAYVKGAMLEVTAPITLSGLVTTANTFYHVYLYDNAGTPAIELSTTAPVIGHGNSYSKTGDDTRRYLGSVLTGAANTIYPFVHEPGNYMDYATSTIVAPFVVQNSAVIGPVRQSCASVVPVTGYRLRALFTNVATDRAVYFVNPALGDSVANRYDLYVVASGSVFSDIGLNASLQYEWGFRASSNGISGVYAKGYYFKR